MPYQSKAHERGIPSFSYDRSETKFNSLFEKTVRHVGTTVTPESMSEIADAVMAVFPSTRRKYVYDSCRSLVGSVVTRQSIATFCRRIAGNSEKLTREPLWPWSVQTELEWSAAVIEASRPSFRDRLGRGTVYQFLSLSGSTAGMVLDRFFSLKGCGYLATNLGYMTHRQARRSKVPLSYMHSSQLVGFRCFILVDPDRSNEYPGFSEVDASSSFLKYNRELAMARYHLTESCPFEYEHYCHQCPVGLDECRLSCHRVEFVAIVCKQCQQSRFANPEHSLELCVSCFERK